MDIADISTSTIVFVEDSRSIYMNGKRYGQALGYVTEDEFNTEVGSTNLRFTAFGNSLQQVAAQSAQALLNAKTQLEDAINAVNDLIEGAEADVSQISDDLDEFKETIRQEITDDITDAITDSNDKTIWTRISEADEGIDAVTNKVDAITDANGDIKYTEALQSVISTGIANDSSITELQSRWALVDANEDILKWMAAGFTSEAAEGESFASVFATLVDDSMPGYQTAVSNLTTRVEDLEDAGYLATANLQTEVETLLGTTLASLALKSDIESASTTLSSSIDTVDGRVDSTNNALALLQLDVTKNDAVVNQLATVGQDMSITYNKAAFDSAIAGLFVQGSQYASASNVSNIASALIEAQVKGDQSWITLSADQINLDGNVIAQRLTTANANIGGWKIGYNKIYNRDLLDDEVTEAGDGITLDAAAQTIEVCKVTEDQSEEADPYVNYDGISIDPVNGLEVYSDTKIDGHVVTSNLAIDGSGYLASGNISWNTAGATSITGEITATSGSIGGWTIDSDKLYGEKDQIVVDGVGRVELDTNMCAVGTKLTVSRGGYTTITGALFDPLGFRTYSNSTANITNQINSDGSGFLGNGGISWSASGNFSVNTQLAATALSALSAGTDEDNPLNGTSITQSGVYVYGTEAELSDDVRRYTEISNNKIEVADLDLNYNIEIGSANNNQNIGITISGGDIVTDRGVSADNVNANDVNTHGLYITYNDTTYELDIQAAISAGIFTQVS